MVTEVIHLGEVELVDSISYRHCVEVHLLSP
jgi:hypothetical protein